VDFLLVAAVSAVATIPAVSILLVLHRIADQVAQTRSTEAADRSAR
jgi:hypothetical protein